MTARVAREWPELGCRNLGSVTAQGGTCPARRGWSQVSWRKKHLHLNREEEEQRDVGRVQGNAAERGTLAKVLTSYF